MKFLKTLLGIGLLAGATAASAEGILPREAPPSYVAESGPRWGGLYIGAAVGAAITETDFRHLYDDGVISGSNIFDLSDTDVTGTVTVGYDVHISPTWVAGVFADYTFGNIEQDMTIVVPATTQNVTLEYEDTWSVGGRLGFVRGSTLWYAMAGYTQTEAKLDPFEERLDGYFVGAGVEHMLRDKWTLKLEYRFSDYGDNNLYTCTDVPGCDETIDIDTHVHAIRVGLTYRFGDRREPVAYDPMK